MRNLLTLIMVALVALPACAKDAGDYQELADKAYPGKVLSLSENDGNVVKIQYADGVTNEEKSAIQAFLSGAAKTEPTQRELDQRVTDKKNELDEPANSAKVSDEEYEALWIKVQAKLDRAKRLTDVQKKQEKLDEAAVLIDAAKEAKRP